MKWRDIPGWELRYAISENGDVKSKDMVVGAKCGKTAVRKGRPLKLVLKNNGYLAVTLTNGVASLQVSVHRLVARAFIGECPLGLHVLHNDGNKGNNHYSNLRYGTPAENVKDTGKHGRQRKGENHPRAKLSLTAVQFILSKPKMLKKALAVQFNVSEAHIKAIQSKRAWKHVK